MGDVAEGRDRGVPRGGQGGQGGLGEGGGQREEGGEQGQQGDQLTRRHPDNQHSRRNFRKIQLRQLLLYHLVGQDGEPGQLPGHRLLDLALLREQHLELEDLPFLLLGLGAHALHHGGVVTTEPCGIIERRGGSAEENLTRQY